MTTEGVFKVCEVKAGDKIRFNGQRKHRRVMAAHPMSDGLVLLIVPGHDNYIRNADATVYIKLE